MFPTKSFKFSVKADATGKFSGRASVYGVVDAHNDVVMPGAFADTILANAGRVKILNQHDPSDVIGLATLTDSDTALLVDGSLVLDLPSAKEAYTRLQNDLLDALSIGYSVPDGGATFKDGVRQLSKVNLWEVSIVTFPANDYARITDVKRMDEGALKIAADVVRELKAGRTLSAANVEKLRQAHDHMTTCADSSASAMEIIAWLVGLCDEQDAKAKAAAQALLDTPSENLVALSALLQDMRVSTTSAA